MLRPLLIIGAGGSGGKTIRSMKQALLRRLETVGYTKGLPAAWQFLQIDTTRDGVDFPAPMLPDDEIHLVVKPHDDFRSVLARITNTGTLPDQQEMLAGWGIATSAITITNGAGQTRAIGRQAGVANSDQTIQAIKSAISKLQGPTADAELTDIGRHLETDRVSKTPAAFIISSLAGGSGAGMFVDIAELLKRASQDPWAADSIAFLYTSEVFESLAAAGANISKNSLGAMNEITVGKWIGISDRTNLLYSKLGLSDSNNSKPKEFGPAGSILVGVRNKTGVNISIGSDGAGMDEVFLTIGEALAGVVTDDTIAQHLFKHAFVNITQTRASIDNSGLAPDPGGIGKTLNPTFAAAGIGFGQMTLGADRIIEYVADALTREQVKKLLWPAFNQELLRDGVTNERIVEEKADEVWPTFLRDSRLDEKGSQDQIITELFPKNWEADCKQFVTSLISKVVSDKPTPLQNFCRSTWNEWENSSEEFLVSLQDKIKENARKWVPDIQKSFRDHVADELVRSGYLVVANLVSKLEDELRNYALRELNHEHELFANAIRGFDQSKFNSGVQELAEGITGVSKQNGPFLTKVVTTLSRVLEFQVKSHVFDLAGSLVEDMLKYLFEPLAGSISNARHELEMAVADKKNRFSSYPEWGSGVVPKKYKARTIERILIDTSEFESTYELYAERDSGGSAPFPKSVNSSLLGKKMNVMPGEKNEQILIEQKNPWVTSVRDAQDQMGSAVAKLEWDFNTNLESLSKRNRQWLQSDQSQFGRYTRVSIREFVEARDEKPEIRKKREDKFVAEYSAMLSLAEPLVSLNANAFQYIINVDNAQPADGVMRKSSDIPFDIKSRVGKECVQILQKLGIDVASPSFEADWFDPGSNDTTLYAVSTTQASLPAWSFASLTEPILNQVAASRTDSSAWIQFWEGRRARPLQEAVPFETQIRLSIITGWFVASLFGLLEKKELSVGRSLQIWNPTLQTPGWSNFPEPLLNTHIQDVRRGWWFLPQLLTSAGLALANFGKTGDQSHLLGYRLLKYLGREVTTSIDGRDFWDGGGVGDMLPTGMPSKSTYIRKWIENGTTPSSNRELNKLLQGNIEKSANRSEALLSTIQQIRDEYAGIWSKLATSPWPELPETWELRHEIDMALADIYTFVKSMEVSESDTSM